MELIYLLVGTGLLVIICNNEEPQQKYHLGTGLSVAWSFGVQLVVFCCSDISVVLFHTLEDSMCHNTFLLSPHL